MKSLVRRRGRIMYYLVEFKTMTKHKQLFVHEPSSITTPLMKDNVTATNLLTN